MSQYPLHEFGGAGAVMHFAPANGFPSQMYHPMLAPLTREYRVVSLLPRALWPNQTPPSVLMDWKEMVMRDLLDGLRAIDAHDVILVGHSFGGIASMLAVIEEPQRFKGLILLDPTILHRDIIGAMKMLHSEGRIHEMPLAARALKRRRNFSNRDEAYDYFKSRPLFADWDETMLRAYVESGLRNAQDGVELFWSPEWEAYYYMGGYPNTYDDLPKLNGLVPTLMIRGANSDTFIGDTVNEVRALVPDAHYVEIANHGHLFPMSAPHETADTIHDFAARL
jgi:pimeloyl-ACP methyl ester carboxylesterase